MNRTFAVIQWVGDPDEKQITNRLHNIGGQIERLEEISFTHSARDQYDIRYQDEIRDLHSKITTLEAEKQQALKQRKGFKEQIMELHTKLHQIKTMGLTCPHCQKITYYYLEMKI